MALLHRPSDETAGLDTEDLPTGEQVAVLPAGHPRTASSSLRLEDVADVADLPSTRRP